LRTEQFTVEPPVIAEDDTPLPSLSIHIGRTKTSGASEDEVVYRTGRPVEALNAWLALPHRVDHFETTIESVWCASFRPLYLWTHAAFPAVVATDRRFT
jgi:hypothetical protein